jgi:hypothetical protein
LYGLIASQLGDVHDDFITQEDGTRTPVADYIYQCASVLLLVEASQFTTVCEEPKNPT